MCAICRLLLFRGCRWEQTLGTLVIPLVSSGRPYIIFDPFRAQWKKHLTAMQILQFIIDSLLFNFGRESTQCIHPSGDLN